MHNSGPNNTFQTHRGLHLHDTTLTTKVATPNHCVPYHRLPVACKTALQAQPIPPPQSWATPLLSSSATADPARKRAPSVTTHHHFLLGVPPAGSPGH